MYTEPYSHQELSARVREWSERTPPRSTLPTSSAREEEWAPRTQPSHPIASSSASAYLHAYRADVEAAARPAPHVYEVAPGVNSNGTMNANYPKVREYLDLMTHSPEARTPPPEECAMVYVLLALDTYEHPTHPAHWMFWGRDRKARTAAAVDLVYFMKPSPIASPICWLGSKENLWHLASIQHAWKDYLPSFSWYSYLVPPPVSASAPKRNLRKRKVAPAAPPPAAESAEPERRPRKKARTRADPPKSNDAAMAMALLAEAAAAVGNSAPDSAPQPGEKAGSVADAAETETPRVRQRRSKDASGSPEPSASAPAPAPPTLGRSDSSGSTTSESERTAVASSSSRSSSLETTVGTTSRDDEKSEKKGDGDEGADEEEEEETPIPRRVTRAKAKADATHVPEPYPRLIASGRRKAAKPAAPRATKGRSRARRA